MTIGQSDVTTVQVQLLERAKRVQILPFFCASWDELNFRGYTPIVSFCLDFVKYRKNLSLSNILLVTYDQKVIT